MRFNYFYDSKHASNVVALKLPERKFKGLLNFADERGYKLRLKHDNGINLLGTALSSTSKNTITRHINI